MAIRAADFIRFLVIIRVPVGVGRRRGAGCRLCLSPTRHKGRNVGRFRAVGRENEEKTRVAVTRVRRSVKVRGILGTRLLP